MTKYSNSSQYGPAINNYDLR